MPPTTGHPPEPPDPPNNEEAVQRAEERARLAEEHAQEAEATARVHARRAEETERQLAALARLRRVSARPTAKVEPAAAKDKHDDDVQRWWLRYVVATVVVLTFWTELIGLYVLVLLQGFGGLGFPYLRSYAFKLDPWLIGVVVVGVLIQTIWCLQNIAAHLFPEGEGKMGSLPKPPGASAGKTE